MTGYESKRAAARDKLDDDDTQVYQAQPAQEPVADWDAWNLISRMNSALEEIGDFAHKKSTGPEVPDALWEICSMAYDAMEDTTPPAAQPAQEPVAHCEAGPEYCVQCKLENRSIVLAAAVRYVKNNTPPLVSDEICMALATPPQRPWVGLTKEAIAEFGTWYDNREEETGWVSPSEVVAYIDAKLKEKNG